MIVDLLTRLVSMQIQPEIDRFKKFLGLVGKNHTDTGDEELKKIWNFFVKNSYNIDPILKKNDERSRIISSNMKNIPKDIAERNSLLMDVGAKRHKTIMEEIIKEKKNAYSYSIDEFLKDMENIADRDYIENNLMYMIPLSETRLEGSRNNIYQIKFEKETKLEEILKFKLDLFDESIKTIGILKKYNRREDALRERDLLTALKERHHNVPKWVKYIENENMGLMNLVKGETLYDLFEWIGKMDKNIDVSSSIGDVMGAAKLPEERGVLKMNGFKDKVKVETYNFKNFFDILDSPSKTYGEGMITAQEFFNSIGTNLKLLEKDINDPKWHRKIAKNSEDKSEKLRSAIFYISGYNKYLSHDRPDDDITVWQTKLEKKGYENIKSNTELLKEEYEKIVSLYKEAEKERIIRNAKINAVKKSLEALLTLQTQGKDMIKEKKFKEILPKIEYNLDYFFSNFESAGCKKNAGYYKSKKKIESSIKFISERLNKCKSFCHNDFHAGNIMIDDKGNDAWIIDFEMSGIGSAEYDIASIIYDPRLKLDNDLKNEGLWDYFYHTDYPQVLSMDRGKEYTYPHLGPAYHLTKKNLRYATALRLMNQISLFKRLEQKNKMNENNGPNKFSDYIAWSAEELNRLTKKHLYQKEGQKWRNLRNSVQGYFGYAGIKI